MALLLRALALVALLSGPMAAHPSTITLDFDDLASGSSWTQLNSNLEYQGFRFSPNCLLVEVPANVFPGEDYDSAWIGTSGVCYLSAEEYGNNDFLGPESLRAVRGGTPVERVIWIDYGGRPFSLESVVNIYDFSTWTSSKGGYHVRTGLEGCQGVTCSVSFDGGEWKGIQWAMFSIGLGTGPPFGFDNLKIKVPEPGTVALLGLGLAGLVFTRRRKK
jgi:hypothetical protein